MMRNRARRLRYDSNLRDLVSENRVVIDDLIYPLFVRSGSDIREEIPTLPGNFYVSPDDELRKEAERILESGLKAILLFGIPEDERRDETGSQARAEDGPVQKACRLLDEEYPELFVITDVCLCAYTSHGQCGIYRDGKVVNDGTLPYLAETALSHVRSGADMVAPSDMMDGRIKAIRDKLDEKGYSRIPIMSYSAKYSSAFYGPFRAAADSAPAEGGRATHQMDPANAREALKVVRRDVKEGADIVMVKPALAYLDIIHRVRQETEVPLAAYNVSGEFALACQGDEADLVEKKAVLNEILTSIRRAGADLIITYHALDFAEEDR